MNAEQVLSLKQREMYSQYGGIRATVAQLVALIKNDAEAQASRTCANCKHWTIDPQCEEYEPDDRWGICSEIYGNGVDLPNYGDGVIEPDGTFGCNRFESKEN